MRLSELAGVSRFRLLLHERGTLSLTDVEKRRIQAAFVREAKRLQEVFRGITA